MAVTKEKLIKWLESHVEQAERYIAEMRERLAAHPAYVLEHSDSAFEAAAELDVYKKVLGALAGKDSKATVETVTDYAHREMTKRAEHVLKSSSMTSRIMSTEVTAAWARLYLFLEG